MMSIQIIKNCVKKLLHDDVIDNTFGVMNQLRSALLDVSRRKDALTGEEKKTLKECLGDLISESIREALHKHELHITNDIIRNKNAILAECGVKVDESHAEINPKNYAWHW